MAAEAGEDLGSVSSVKHGSKPAWSCLIFWRRAVYHSSEFVEISATGLNIVEEQGRQEEEKNVIDEWDDIIGAASNTERRNNTYVMLQ